MVDGTQWPDVPSEQCCNAEGCKGVRSGSLGWCIAHLDETSLQQVLGGLGPGADLDLRGVLFTTELLERLLGALRDPDTGFARIGTAGFRGACFAERALFEDVGFQGKVVFLDASFNGPASFRRVRFDDRTWFEGAQFNEIAVFNDASFRSDAFFSRARFGSLAWFQRARFGGNAWFSETHFGGAKISESDDRPRSSDFTGAQFTGMAEFQNANFDGDALFRQAQFEHGPMVSGVRVSGDLEFSQVQFSDCERLGPAAVAGSRSAADE